MSDLSDLGIEIHTSRNNNQVVTPAPNDLLLPLHCLLCSLPQSLAIIGVSVARNFSNASFSKYCFMCKKLLHSICLTCLKYYLIALTLAAIQLNKMNNEQ